MLAEKRNKRIFIKLINQIGSKSFHGFQLLWLLAVNKRQREIQQKKKRERHIRPPACHPEKDLFLLRSKSR
jgi:hypothetical protein